MHIACSRHADVSTMDGNWSAPSCRPSCEASIARAALSSRRPCGRAGFSEGWINARRNARRLRSGGTPMGRAFDESIGECETLIFRLLSSAMSSARKRLAALSAMTERPADTRQSPQSPRSTNCAVACDVPASSDMAATRSDIRTAAAHGTIHVSDSNSAEGTRSHSIRTRAAAVRGGSKRAT